MKSLSERFLEAVDWLVMRFYFKFSKNTAEKSQRIETQTKEILAKDWNANEQISK